MYVKLPDTPFIFSYNYVRTYCGIISANNPTAKYWYYMNGIPVYCTQNPEDDYAFQIHLPSIENEMQELLDFSKKPIELINENYDEIIHEGLAGGHYFWMEPSTQISILTADQRQVIPDTGMLITGVNDVDHSYSFLSYQKVGGIKHNRMKQGRSVVMPMVDYILNDKQGCAYAVSVKNHQYDFDLSHSRQLLAEYISLSEETEKQDSNKRKNKWQGIHLFDGLIAHLGMCCEDKCIKNTEGIQVFFNHQFCLVNCISALSKAIGADDASNEVLKSMLDRAHCLRYMCFDPSNPNRCKDFQHVVDLLYELKNWERNTIKTLVQQLG